MRDAAHVNPKAAAARAALVLMASLAAALAPHAARAGLPATRTQVLLRAPVSPAHLRANLLAYADSAAASDRYGAGEAWEALGESWARAGRSDSAVVAFRHAVELRNARPEQLALADALLARRRPGDVAGARERLARLAFDAQDERPASQAQVLGRLAWAQTLDGSPDSASALFGRLARALGRSAEWRYRMARACAASDPHQVVDLLLPNAVLSRGTDHEVMTMLRDAAKAAGVDRRLDEVIAREVAGRDKNEAALLATLGARRVRFPASDGFPLCGVLFQAAGARRHAPAAVILMAPGDTIASYDSLATRLAQHGLPTLLLDLRGSGWSVAPSCPTPTAWGGREDAMAERVALDVSDAIAALTQEAGADSTRALVVAAGATAALAVEAAEFDHSIRALLLVSPAPPPTDRGATAWRLARLQLPAFYQVAPEDYDTSYEITEALYQSGNRARSRQVDAKVPGHGMEVFRNDPTLTTRFLAWLDGAWSAARPVRAAARRRG